MRIPKLFGPLKQRLILILLIAFLGFSFSMQAAEKPRVIVLTDIGNEPDDAMSMVRFLTYSNHWDVFNHRSRFGSIRLYF